MNLPNKLTTIRLLFVPLLVIIYLLPYESLGINVPTFHIFSTSLSLVSIICFLLFTIASFTDYLDGYLARKNNQVTTFGKFIDPIADKLIVNTALLLLTSSGDLSVIVPIIMISRDTIVDAIRMVAVSNNKVLAASYLGKAKTMTQMIAICILLLNNVFFNDINVPMGQIMIVIATIISVISGIDYFIKNKDFITESM
jgi:CDP-diacylglycerol--glycerol-3-phosphate 3-phosphatidyltransferase